MAVIAIGLAAGGGAAFGLCEICGRNIMAATRMSAATSSTATTRA
jgi:hypothetical protein